MIGIKNLSYAFHQHEVLKDLSFNFQKGEVVAIIGASGAGKSTLLRSFNYLEKPKKGILTVEDFEFDMGKHTKSDVIELRKQTAMVFQQFNLFRQKTALENVMEGLVVVQKQPKEKAREIAEKELEKVGLSDRANHYPQHLSGGQKQRVAIARALALKPNLLLLDEPTSALDPELVGEVLATIKLAAKEGNTMLLVSHEMNFVRGVADRVLFLENGSIIEDGAPDEVFSRPKSNRTKQFLANYYQEEEPEYFI